MCGVGLKADATKTLHVWVTEGFPGLHGHRFMKSLRKIRGERSASQGVVAGAETLCRAHDGATGG